MHEEDKRKIKVIKLMEQAYNLTDQFKRRPVSLEYDVNNQEVIVETEWDANTLNTHYDSVESMMYDVANQMHKIYG